MQPSLFGRDAPDFDASFRGAQRRDLEGGAWLEHQAGFLSGHEWLFGALASCAEWTRHRREMYERVVEVPRLTAPAPTTGAAARVLGRVSVALSRRYGRRLDSVHMALYRDGDDSVAMHGDKMGPFVDDAVIGILSVGAPRRFLLKPAGVGASLRYSLGWGDLLVMGGTCQRTWLHGVPKVRHADPRISIQFRQQIPEAARTDATIRRFDSRWTPKGRAAVRYGRVARRAVVIEG